MCWKGRSPALSPCHLPCHSLDLPGVLESRNPALPSASPMLTRPGAHIDKYFLGKMGKAGDT